jgi:aflatoxin B1 aldehyde reductase
VHDLKDAAAMLDVFQKYGHKEVDTARVYGGGSSDEYLGKLNWQERGLVMETKLYSGSLYASKITHNAADLRKYLLESPKALKAKKIDMWYLHGPDRKTPYEETFRVVDELHKEGYFDRFGISNYMS